MYIKQAIRYLVITIKINLLKLRYPKAGYCERVLLANGFEKGELDSWVEEAIEDGWIKADDQDGREEVFGANISYMEG